VGVDLQSLIAQSGVQAQLSAAMTPDMQSTLQKGADLVADAAPAFGVISDLANGKGISPNTAIMAMAGVAAAVNPLAGAVVLAMGTVGQGLTNALNDVFQQLGLQHTPPRAKLIIGGLGVDVDHIPYPPQIKGSSVQVDPQWKNWEWLIQENTTSGGIIQGLPNYLASMTQYELNGAPASPDGHPMVMLTSALAGSAHWYHYNGNGAPSLPTPKNDFERFFFEILKRDIEYWWNAQVYMPPRQLLTNAIATWNKAHQPSDNDVAYQPGTDSIPAYVLYADTDTSGTLGTGNPTDSVNMGAQVTAPPKGVPASNVTTIHVPLDIGVQTMHVMGPKVQATPENLAFAAVFNKYKAQGMSDQAALDAAGKELSTPKVDLAAISAQAVANAVNNAKVIVAKPVKPGWSTMTKVVVVSALAAALALVARAKG
jgi:hypothetical protein